MKWLWGWDNLASIFLEMSDMIYQTVFGVHTVLVVSSVDSHRDFESPATLHIRQWGAISLPQSVALKHFIHKQHNVVVLNALLHLDTANQGLEMFT
jgi:hypothetical protein